MSVYIILKFKQNIQMPLKTYQRPWLDYSCYKTVEEKTKIFQLNKYFFSYIKY